MSNRFGPPDHFRSTEELARHLGLSRWTVSRALNGHPGVSRATRDKIERLAKARRFRPSLIAATLRSGKAPILGAVIPHLQAYRLGPKLVRLQAAAPSLGLRLVVEMSGNDPHQETEALENIAALRPAGLIQFASSLPPHHPTRQPFTSAHLPVVQIDPFHHGHPATVYSDRASATETAINHLIHTGCRHLLLFGFPAHTPYGRARWRGIRRALQRHQLTLGTNAENISLGPRATDTPSDGEALVRLALPSLRRHRRKVVGILAMNDLIALGALRALLREGYQPGANVRIIGYDNAEFSAFTTPSLSTIDPCAHDLIDAAIRLLQASHASPVPPESPVRILPRLVARESTLGLHSQPANPPS